MSVVSEAHEKLLKDLGAIGNTFATDQILQGVDLAFDRLDRDGISTQDTTRALDELRHEVMRAAIKR